MSQMKRVILSYLFLLSVFVMSYAQDSTVVKNVVAPQADAAYNEGNFQQAISAWEEEKEIQKKIGLESPELYYNLGNAYFRANEIAKARLYYERALLLDPGDRDIRHNIDYVTTKIEDKILIADTFFLSVWFNAVQNLFSSNAWATLAVISFILFVICLSAFFFVRYITVKKIAFYASIVLILIVIFTNIFAFGQKNKVEHRNTAIIMAGSASVVSSPDINSKELFILHAGTKVSITKEDRNWLEIEIDNGSVGWIQRDKLEII